MELHHLTYRNSALFLANYLAGLECGRSAMNSGSTTPRLNPIKPVPRKL